MEFQTPSSCFSIRFRYTFSNENNEKENFLYWGNGSIIKKKIFKDWRFSYNTKADEDYEIIFRMKNNKNFIPNNFN